MKNLALLLVSLLLVALLCGCGVSEEALRPYLSPPGTAPAPTPSPTPAPQPDLTALDLKILTRIFAGAAGSRGARFRPRPAKKTRKSAFLPVWEREGKISGKNAKKLLTKTTCLRIIVHVAERCGTQEMRKRDEAVRGA